MPAILIVKGDDRIPVEQFEGERLLDKIRTLVSTHGADNVLLDGVPCSKAPQFDGAILTASDYDRGYADGLAAGKAEAAEPDHEEPGVELGVGSDFSAASDEPAEKKDE